MLSVKPSNMNTSPQDVVVSAVIQAHQLLPSSVRQLASFGDPCKLAFIDEKMKIQLIHSSRKTKVN
jgi:hypothetical protein